MYVWHSHCFGKEIIVCVCYFLQLLLSNIFTYILVLKRKWTYCLCFVFWKALQGTCYVSAIPLALSHAHLNLYISINVKPSSDTSSEVATCRPDAPAKRQWNVS